MNNLDPKESQTQKNQNHLEVTAKRKKMWRVKLFSFIFVGLATLLALLTFNLSANSFAKKTNTAAAQVNEALNLNSSTNGTAYSPNSTTTSLANWDGTQTAQPDYPIDNKVDTSELKVGDVTTKGSLKTLGAVRAFYFLNLGYATPANAIMSDWSFYDINGQKVSWSFDLNWSMLNTREGSSDRVGFYNTNHYSDDSLYSLNSGSFVNSNNFKTFHDAVTDDDSSITMNVGNNYGFDSQTSALSSLYGLKSPIYTQQSQRQEQNTAVAFWPQYSQFRIVLDRPAIIDKMTITSSFTDFKMDNVAIESSTHEIFSLVRGQTIVPKIDANSKVNSSASYTLATFTDKTSITTDNANNHLYAGEYWNRLNYFGGSDTNAYLWRNMRANTTNGSLSGSALSTAGANILSYQAKPGYEALFVKESTGTFSTSTTKTMDGTTYPTRIPTVDQLNHYDMNYGWIMANPGDKVYLYIVKDSFDFSGVLTSTKSSSTPVTVNSDAYASFISQARISGATTYIVKDSGDNYKISVPDSSARNAVKVIDFDINQVPTIGSFVGFTTRFDRYSAFLGGSLMKLNYENMNLPKDANGNYEVSAYIFTKDYGNDTYWNDSIPYNGQPAALGNGLWEKLDFNQGKDYIFSLYGGASQQIRLLFVPNAGYVFNSVQSSQLKTLDLNGLSFPETQQASPVISTDSFLGNQNMITTNRSLSALGKISSAKLDFTPGSSLYNIRFVDRNNNIVPYTITDFKSDLNSPAAMARKWSDRDLARLTTIESTDLDSSWDIKNQTTDSAYPVWQTVDGKPEDGTNGFIFNSYTYLPALSYATIPYAQYERRIMHFEFSFANPSIIDHVEYSAPIAASIPSGGVTSVAYVEMTNTVGETFSTSIFAWNKVNYGLGSATERRLAFDKNGDTIWLTPARYQTSTNLDWYNVSTTITNISLDETFGLNVHDWLIKGNPLTESLQSPSELGDIKGGTFGLYASAVGNPPDYYQSLARAISDVIIYDENGVAIPYTISTMQAISSWNTGNQQPGWMSDYVNVAAQYQDDSETTTPFRYTVFRGREGSNTEWRKVDETEGLGRYYPYVKFVWSFADGKPHKISYIKAKTSYPDESFNTPSDKWGNYAAKLDMSFITSANDTFIARGVQGTTIDGSKPESVFTTTKDPMDPNPTDSYFGKIEKLPLQKVVYQLGDAIHLDSFDKFYAKDAYLADSFADSTTNGWTMQIYNSATQTWQSPQDFILTNFDPIQVRVQTVRKTSYFIGTNLDRTIEYTFTPSPVLQNTIRLADDIYNFSDVKYLGTNSTASVSIDSLRVSSYMDVIIENGKPDGTWSAPTTNYSSESLSNGQKIRITLRARQGAAFVKFSDGTSLPSTITGIVTVAGLKPSSKIPIPSAQNFTLGFNGYDSLGTASLNIPTNANYSFAYDVTRSGKITSYQVGNIPSDLRNGDSVTVNLVANPGYYFEDASGNQYSRVAEFIKGDVKLLQQPLFVDVPQSFQNISQDSFLFSRDQSNNLVLVAQPSNANDIFALAPNLEKTANIDVSYIVYTSGSLIPYRTYLSINDLRSNLVENSRIEISITPKTGYVFGNLTTYRNLPRTYTKEITVKASSGVQAQTVPYKGSGIFPANLNITGANGRGVLSTDSSSWITNDLSALFTEDSAKITYTAYLFRKADIDAKKVFPPNLSQTTSGFFDGTVYASDSRVVTRRSTLIFDRLSNGDIVVFVAKKEANATWIDAVQQTTDAAAATLPTGNTYFFGYTLNNIPVAALDRDFTIDQFNFRMIGQAGHIKFAAGDTGYQAAPAVVLTDPSKVFSVKGIVISASTKKSSDFDDIISLYKNSAFAPYMINGGLSSTNIPAYTDAINYETLLKNGNAPWIYSFDPLSQTQDLPIFAGDTVLIYIKAKDGSSVSEQYNYYLKEFTVPTLNKVINSFQAPGNQNIVNGSNHNGYFNEPLFRYDLKTMDINFSLKSVDGSISTWKFVPGQGTYSQIANGDEVTITATPKLGYWWDLEADSNFYKDATPYKNTFVVTWLPEKSTPIPFEKFLFPDPSLEITGQNGNASLVVSSNSDLHTYLSAKQDDNYLYSIGFRVEDGVTGLINNYWLSDEWVKNWNADNSLPLPFSTIKNTDKITLIYLVKPPFSFVNIPPEEQTGASFQSNETITVTTLAKSIFNDAKVPRAIIQSVTGTRSLNSQSVQVYVPVVDPAYGTIKLSALDKSGNVVSDNLVPNVLNKNISTDAVTIRATLIPNKGNNYWVDYDANNKQPNQDIFVVTKDFSFKTYVDPQAIIDKINSAIINNPSVLKQVITSMTSYSGYSVQWTVDRAKLFDLVPELKTNDIAVRIMFGINDRDGVTRDVSVVDTSYFGLETYNADNSKNTPTSHIYNSADISRDNYSKVEVSTSNTNIDLSENGLGVRVFTSKTSPLTLGPDVLTFFKVLTSNDLQVNAPTISNNISAPQYFYLDNLYGKIPFADLQTMINNGQIEIGLVPLPTGSNDPYTALDNDNQAFWLTSTRKELAIALEPSPDPKEPSTAIRITYSPRPEANNTVTRLDPNRKYTIVFVTKDDANMKVWDTSLNPYFDVTKLRSRYASTIIDFSGLYNIISPKLANDFKLANNVDGKGQVDSSIFPTNPDPNYSISVIVARDGVNVSVIDNVTSSTPMYDKLQIGDEVSIVFNINGSNSTYRFDDGSASKVYQTVKMDRNNMVIEVTPPRKLTNIELGLTGASTQAAIPSITKFTEGLRNVNVKILLKRVISPDYVEVQTLNSLSNGDKIQAVYTTVDGAFVLPDGTRTTTYTVDYDINGLDELIKTPDFSDQNALQFISNSGTITPAIDWAKIFANVPAADRTHMTASFSVLDSIGTPLTLPSSDPNYLQNLPIDFNLANSQMNAQLNQLNLSLGQRLRIKLSALQGYQFDNYNGKNVQTDVILDSSKLQKEIRDLSKFFTFNQPGVTLNASGYAGLTTTDFPFDQMSALGLNMVVTVNGKDYDQSTFGNIKLANNDNLKVTITANDPNRYVIRYGSDILNKLEKVWNIAGLNVVINNPVPSDDSLKFGEINGSGKITSTNFGVFTPISPIFQYRVKHSADGDDAPFSGYASSVKDLSNGDVVRVQAMAPTGYTFLATDSTSPLGLKAVTNFEIDRDYVVSGLKTSKADIKMPDSISITHDPDKDTYRPENLDVATIENDPDLTISYNLGDGSAPLTKWNDIPKDFFNSGRSLGITVNVKPGANAVFGDNKTQLQGNYNLFGATIDANDVFADKNKGFIENADGTYDFNTSLLNQYPFAQYTYTVEDPINGSKVVTSPTNIPAGSSLVINIVPRYPSSALVFDKQIEGGTVTLFAPRVSQENTLDVTLPSKMPWVGNDGAGTIDTSSPLINTLFNNSDLKFTFTITGSDNKIRTVYTLKDLNVSNNDKVKIDVQAINGKIFANGSNVLSATYTVDGLVNANSETNNQAIIYSLVALGAIAVIWVSTLAVIKIRKALKR